VTPTVSAKDRWKGAINTVKKQNSVMAAFMTAKQNKEAHQKATHDKMRATFNEVRTQNSVVSFLRRDRLKGQPSKIRKFPFSFIFSNFPNLIFHPVLLELMDLEDGLSKSEE